MCMRARVFSKMNDIIIICMHKNIKIKSYINITILSELMKTKINKII